MLSYIHKRFKLARKTQTMYINAVLSPALGKTTVVTLGRKSIRFVAFIETSHDSRYRDDGWTVQLWHSSSRGWQASDFAPTNDHSLVMGFKKSDLKQQVYTLELGLENSESFRFTLRLKPEDKSPWVWSKEQTGVADGHLLFQTALCGQQNPFNFTEIFESPDCALSIKTVPSQVSNVKVFEVSATAPPLPNAFSIAVLGTPLLLENYYALVKLSSPWMGPRQGTAPFVVDKDALMAGYIRSDGRHVVVLGVSGVDDCTTYVQALAGRIVLKTRNDGVFNQYHRAIVATGFEYQKTVDAAFYRAREIIGSLVKQDNPAVGEESKIKEKLGPVPAWYETWYDGLAYCTWNGLGRELSEDKILSALQDLSDNGVNVSTLIIDDNWQSLDNHRRWDRFEANENFPKGLAHTTSTIRRRFKNIKHIAVWHALLGYWEGISPGGWIAANYKCTTVKWHGGWDVCVVDEPDVGQMYNDFYKFLVSSGVDAVKCDVEAAIDEFDDGAVRQRLGRAYQDAFKLYSLRWFSRRVIYCMAHVPYIFFRALLPHDGPRVLFRNSDDFFPDIPKSHAWHVFANAMNNIFTSHLNGLPDWDMFQSPLPDYGGLHAAARCISGGPIYITDTPNQHNVSLIKQMSALSPQGHTVILRPSRVALPIDPFVAYNNSQLLKVGNFCGGVGGSSLVAVFNISETENSELISIDEFPGIVLNGKYVVRSHRTSGVSGILVGGQGSLIPTTVLQNGWEFYNASPVRELIRADDKTPYFFGVFGLISAISGAAAVLGQSISTGADRAVISITLKALGTLGLYISDLATRDITNLLITISGSVIPFSTVRRSTECSTVLEVDVDEAWKQLGLSAGWSNEVTVVLYIR